MLVLLASDELDSARCLHEFSNARVEDAQALGVQGRRVQRCSANA
jgi:hypothetical protein